MLINHIRSVDVASDTMPFEKHRYQHFRVPFTRGRFPTFSCSFYKASTGFITAFTLIELLVVIAIIAMLIGLILPVLGHVRSTARTSMCAGRMRRLHMMTELYGEDNFEFYPQPFEDQDLYDAMNSTPGGDPEIAARAMWFNALDLYIGKGTGEYRFKEPDSRVYLPDKQDPVWDGLDEERRKSNRTIKMNYHFGVLKGTTLGRSWMFFRHVNVRHPSQTVLYADGRALDILDGPAPQCGHFHATEGTVALRHSDGANVAFTDGHTRFVTQEINNGNTVLGWYTQSTGRQELIWNFLD